MYCDKNKRVINDGDVYVNEKGTKYPSNFPREDIIGLFKVKETTCYCPNNKQARFEIDDDFNQIWIYEELNILSTEQQKNTIDGLQSDLLSNFHDPVKNCYESQKVLGVDGKYTNSEYMDMLNWGENVRNVDKKDLTFEEQIELLEFLTNNRPSRNKEESTGFINKILNFFK